MTAIISILNMKGGVGKTTTSVNLAQGLGILGYKTLLVDLDPQANSTDMFIDSNDHSYTYIDEILNGEPIQSYPTKNEGVSIIPSRLDLATTERNILLSTKAQHNRLYKALRDIKNDFDYIIIDCPPILNLLTVNALNASNEVIIPIKIDKAAQKGFQITLENIKEISDSYDLEIKYRVLFTMVTRTKVDNQKIEEITKECTIKNVIQTRIRNQAKPIKEASYSQGVIVDGKSGVGCDYLNLVNELLEQWR